MIYLKQFVKNDICTNLKPKRCCTRNMRFKVRDCMRRLLFEVYDCMKRVQFEVRLHENRGSKHYWT